jgi:hypothetical protein
VPLRASLQSLLGTVVIAVFVITFIVQAFQIPSPSMENTLLIGDYLLVNKLCYGGGRRGRLSDAVPPGAARRHRRVSLSGGPGAAFCKARDWCAGRPGAADQQAGVREWGVGEGALCALQPAGGRLVPG